jgi:molybdopterin-guanine dinucleotide biosynthesis protein A
VTALVVGIFVGGAGTRMGGVAKGLLTTPSGVSVIERLCGEITAALPSAELVLVGSAEPYRALGLPEVSDRPSGIGPLGGLCGLLSTTREHALVLPCDLPRIESALIARLAQEQSAADALVIDQDGVRNPLIARYRCAPVLAAAQRVLARGKRSLQAVLDDLATFVAEIPNENCILLSAHNSSVGRRRTTTMRIRRTGHRIGCQGR